MQDRGSLTGYIAMFMYVYTIGKYKHFSRGKNTSYRISLLLDSKISWRSINMCSLIDANSTCSYCFCTCKQCCSLNELVYIHMHLTSQKHQAFLLGLGRLCIKITIFSSHNKALTHKPEAHA